MMQFNLHPRRKRKWQRPTARQLRNIRKQRARAYQAKYRASEKGQLYREKRLAKSKNETIRKREMLAKRVADERNRLKESNARAIRSADRAASQYERSGKNSFRAGHLMRHYGLTLEEYARMLAEQGGACAICGITPQEGGKELAVDHDHMTGKVRGLLCSPCNAGLGQFRDSTTLVEHALVYLKREVKS